MPSEPAQEAAAGVASDFFSEVEPFTEQEETEQPNEATDEVEQSQEEEAPEVNWETPPEIQELLATPDFDDEDDGPEEETWEGEGGAPGPDDEGEYETPEMARLRKQNAKLQKKLAWAEEQKAKASQKEWAAEARKYFQFSNPEVIQAKSRRAFLKQAQAQHQAVAQVAKPLYDQLAAERAALKEQAKAEARAEAEAAWGRPTAGPQTNSNYTENTQTTQRRRLEAGQSLASVVKQKFRNGEVNL